MDATNSTNRTDNRSRLRLYFFGFLIISSLSLRSQTSNSDFDRIKLFSNELEYSGIALSPDKNLIAVSFKKLEPVKIVNWKNQKIIQEFNAGNWTYGSKITYSEGGKYLLLQELSYMDFSQNKKRNIEFEIIDTASGKSVKRYNNVQDVVISSDEKYAVSLSNYEVTFCNLANGSNEKSITVSGAANAIALSSDGKTLAVSEMIDPINLKTRFKKDKKGLKNAVKFKQMVGLYDVESKSRIKTTSELYDLIYRLCFLPESDILLVLQTPEIRIQANNNKQSFINLIDLSIQEPLRKGFTSMSIAQPELKFSNDNKLLAINSKGSRFQEIHLYDFESGTLLKRFELAKRLFEKSDGEKIQSDPRPSFVFLPGDQEILVAIGNQLIKWNIESNQ